MKNKLDKSTRVLSLISNIVKKHSYDDVTLSRATTLDDYEQSYRLIYDVFLENKFISPNKSGMRIRACETSKDIAFFVVKNKNNKIIACSSIIINDSKTGLANESIFYTEFDNLRESGNRLCEITNTSIIKKYGNGSVLMDLSRALFAYALYLKVTHIFTCFDADHDNSIFKYVLQFKPIGEKRSHTFDNSNFVKGYILDVKKSINESIESDKLLGKRSFLYNYFLKENPYIDNIEKDNKKISTLFSDPNFLRELFIEKGRILEILSEEDISKVKKQWGEELFNKACE